MFYGISLFSQSTPVIKKGLVYDNGKIKVYSKVTEQTHSNARLILKTPDRKIKAGTNTFQYRVDEYTLKEQTSGSEKKVLANSSKGQHLHFIVDNAPYQAKYDPNFEAQLEPGTHVVLAFLSRSFHESVKAKNAYVLKQYQIGSDTRPLVHPKKDPMLFYSRPKGVYPRDKKHQVLLDFYLVNTVLSKKGNKVKITLDGISFTVAKWEPYIIEGLDVGEHTIAITLINDQGLPVPGPFNFSGPRKFEIQ